MLFQNKINRIALEIIQYSFIFTSEISSYLFNNYRFTYKAINVCITTHLSSEGD